MASLSSLNINWKVWSLFWSKALVFSLEMWAPDIFWYTSGCRMSLHCTQISCLPGANNTVKNPLCCRRSQIAILRVGSLYLFSLSYWQKSDPVQFLMTVGTFLTVVSKAMWAFWNLTLPFWVWCLLQLPACWRQMQVPGLRNPQFELRRGAFRGKTGTLNLGYSSHGSVIFHL